MEPIETERLILRPYEDSDAERVLDIHSRLEVIRWFSNPPWTPMPDLDAARAWIDNWRTKRAGDVRFGGWAMEVKATGVVAGTVVLGLLPNGDGEIQVGWHLHPDSTGNGYVTEGAAKLLDFGFANGLDEVWCGMFTDNDASAAVARRLGLPEIGVIDDPWYGGQSLVFKVTREEWTHRDRD